MREDGVGKRAERGLRWVGGGGAAANQSGCLFHMK